MAAESGNEAINSDKPCHEKEYSCIGTNIFAYDWDFPTKHIFPILETKRLQVQKVVQGLLRNSIMLHLVNKKSCKVLS